MSLKLFSILFLIGVLSQTVLANGAKSKRSNNNSPFETALGMDEVNLEQLKEHLFETLEAFEEGQTIPPSPFQFTEICNEHAIFRSITGVCNNLIFPLIGSTNTPQQRFVPNRYDDGLESPTTNFPDVYGYPGNTLPSARAVSLAVHLTASNLSSDFSHFLMNWGQFLDHDMILTPFLEGLTAVPSECCEYPLPDGFEECFPIATPYDPKFDNDCLPFKRSEPVPGFDFSPVERFAIDEVSSYIDASMVYGPNSANAASLRTNSEGRFKVTPRSGGQIGLPDDPENPTDCSIPAGGQPPCSLLAGDVRVTEQAALSSMHTLLVREHNRIAEGLHGLQVTNDDEILFQTARRIVGAIVQQISFREFLPVVLGPALMDKYSLNLLETGYFDGYISNVDTSISTAWGASAFRFGHTLIRQSFQVAVGVPVDIAVIFDSFNTINAFGANGLLNGLATDRVESLDARVTAGVRDHLFNEPNDLASLNIQRGRDHGIGSYNDFRRFFQLPTFSTFEEYVYAGIFSHEAASNLASVYYSPDDVEIFPGGLSEKAVEDGLIGETLGNILGFQFKIIKFGDRFWYETSDPKIKFSEDELREIRKVVTATLFCENTDVPQQRPWIMRLESASNPVTDCSYFPSIDFEVFRDFLTDLSY